MIDDILMLISNKQEKIKTVFLNSNHDLIANKKEMVILKNYLQ